MSPSWEPVLVVSVVVSVVVAACVCGALGVFRVVNERRLRAANAALEREQERGRRAKLDGQILDTQITMMQAMIRSGERATRLRVSRRRAAQRRMLLR